MLLMKDDLFEAIKDRFEGWELVDLLSISTEEILLMFEDEVFQKLEEIKELLNIEDEENDY